MELEETLNIIQEELKPSLTKHCYNISTYGSAARGEDFIPGWSDVDVLIVPNYNFHCPRGFYDEVGSWYTRVRERIEKKGVKWGIEDEIGFSSYDKSSIESGHYLWVMPSFKEHLMTSAKVIWGDNFRDILSDKCPESAEAWGLAHGLWRTRVSASTSDYNRKHKKEKFMYDFKKSTKSLGNFFRDAVFLKGGKLRSDAKPAIAEQFIELFPEVDSETVVRILGVPFLWPDKLSKNEMTDVFYKGLEIRETVIEVLTKSKERV